MLHVSSGQITSRDSLRRRDSRTKKTGGSLAVIKLK